MDADENENFKGNKVKNWPLKSSLVHVKEYSFRKGGLPSMESKRVGQGWSDLAHMERLEGLRVQKGESVTQRSGSCSHD